MSNGAYRWTLVGWLVLAALAGPPALAGQEQDNSPPIDWGNSANHKTITARTYSLNAVPGGPATKSHLDGQWLCNLAASDGKVYFGVSTHDWKSGAMFCQYDPAAKQVNVLCPDIDVPCGEYNDVLAGLKAPQGKLHSALVENDGYLYTGTYYGYNGPGYAGNHLLRYKLGSFEAGAAEVDDLGIPQAGSKNYAMVAVNKVTDQAHLFLDGGFFYQFFDTQGNRWSAGGTVYKNGSAVCALPPIRDPNDPGLPPSGTTWPSFYFGANPTDADGKVNEDVIVFQQGFDGTLYKLDTKTAAITKVAQIGLGGLDMCVGGHTVYWLQSATPWGTWYTDPSTGRLTKYTSDCKAADQHLMSIDVLNPGDGVKDWGRVIDQAGRTPWRCEGMSADANGNVYLTGDWRLLRDANDSVPLEERPYTCIRMNDAVPGTYWDYANDRPWRGQFFAVVNVPEPAMIVLLLAGGLAIRRRT